MIDKINGLANKGFKILGLVVLVIIVYEIISSYFDNTPSSVKDVKTDLFLGYHEKIYPTAICSIKEINSSWVILCHPKGQAVGGLFEVDPKSGVLYALNGKAQSHAEVLGIAVEVKRDSNIVPSEAFKEFQLDM